MADKIVVMRAGKIEQIGSPDDVYDRPASKYVADFIGASAINFLEGQVVTGAGAPAVDTAAGRVILAPGTGAQPGQKVIVGIRPTDVTLDDQGSLAATAVLSERLGHDAQLFCDGPAGRFTASVDKGLRFTPGQAVRFSVAPPKVHVFDAGTEARL